MVVILVFFAAFFAVAYLISILRRDTEASRAATIDDMQEIWTEIGSLRERLENLEAIEAASTLDLDRERLDDQPAESTEESAARRIRAGRQTQ